MKKSVQGICYSKMFGLCFIFVNDFNNLEIYNFQNSKFEKQFITQFNLFKELAQSINTNEKENSLGTF